MTKRLSNADKVNNLSNRINAIPGYGTIVRVEYLSSFREIVLSGDGMLAVKGIMNENGNFVKITKCPGFTRKIQGIPQCGGNSDRDPAICDMFFSPPITFAKFESICKKYKKAWTHT